MADDSTKKGWAFKERPGAMLINNKAVGIESDDPFTVITVEDDPELKAQLEAQWNGKPGPHRLDGRASIILNR